MMTTNKLTKTFASGSLAIGVLAGAVLTATSASASGLIVTPVITTWGNWTAGNPLQLSDGTTATYVSGSIGADPLDEVGLFKPGDEYEFQYNATTAGSSGLNGTQNGSFTYTITFAQPVIGVALDVDATANYGTVTKEIDGLTPPFPPLVSVNGSEAPPIGFQPISPQLSLTVTDTISNPNGPGEQLSTISNNFQRAPHVPEPGTILGLLAVGGLGLVSRFKKQK